jgi:hypothetical protein
MTRAACTAVAALALLLTTGVVTAAQDTGTFDLQVMVRNCDAELVEFFTQPQEGCVPGAGAFFNVTADNGDFLGNCEAEVTASPIFAGCSVEVPYGITGIVTEDLASLPAGYVPVQNPVPFRAEHADGEDYGTMAIFINELQGGPVTTDLPNTGAGVSAPDGQPAAMPVAVALAMLAAGAFVAGRQRSVSG